MTGIDISIIILTKNEAEYIGSTLDTVFGQDIDKRFEVIIIDSGSKDSTLDIARRYPVKISEIPAQDFGHGRTRNQGAGMAKGEIVFCQGWSEPNAGSDLASLTTRAVEDGDDYILNGQKIWTTGGHRADHIFILARTDPNVKKHKGLTYFLSELDRPGITVRPLYYMNRAHVYNEVFLDNVRIPKKNIVGGVNQGWYVTMAGVNFERSGAGGIAGIRRDFEELVQFCRETSYRGQPLGKDPIIKHRLAQLAVEIEAARQWAWYVVWLQTQDPLGTLAEPSASKYFLTELTMRMANVGVDAMGLYGTVRQGSKWAQLFGKFESMCQINLGATIAGGSSETQRNIIAWMKLGLPRS